MTTDGSSSSSEAGRSQAKPWPLPESEIAATEALLIDIHAIIAQIAQTIRQAESHLAALQAAAPALRQVLLSVEMEREIPGLADLQAARGLRAELVKAAQQSVLVSQSASRYLQAREKFLLARRDWAEQARE